MRKALIVLVSIIGLLLIILLVIPVFFKGDILRIIENQTSRHTRAELSIGDMSLSMFRNFPNLNVALKEVILTGKDEYVNDTIVHIPLFEASVNLGSLISGNEMVINKILLKDGRFTPTVTASGHANWDILMPADTTASAAKESGPSPDNEKGIRLNDIQIENLYIAYNDYRSSAYASVESVNMQLSGNFSADNTLIDVALLLDNISFRQQNSVWVSNTDVKWEAQIGANLRDKVFNLEKNDLELNDLELDLTGSIAVTGDNRYKTDLKLNAPDTKFESLLALVPKTMQHYIEGVETAGDFTLNAAIRGEYYEKHLPAFDVNLAVSNASVKYPSLPESIRGINIDLNAGNPGGSIDSTVIDLKRISFNIAGNPFHAFLTVANPNDPQLDGGARGVINFASLKQALPLKDITLQGIVNTDITFKGKYQYIEKEEYEKFIAKGSVVLKDILFVNADFPQGIAVPQGSIVITPARLNLNNLQAKVHSSDFTLKGDISNYLPYIFKNGTLKGNFSLNSDKINLNEFIIASASKNDTTATAKSADKATASEGILEVPKNINIQLNTNIGTILFDQLTIRNTKGRVNLANGVATLGNLSMDMLNGNMVMNGKYSTANPQAPLVDFKINLSDFDIREVYNSFSFIRKSIPITMDCQGKISSTLQFSSTLDQTMGPVMKTANGSGYVESKGIVINNNPAMNQLAGILKNEELSRLSISNMKISFKLDNGNIIVEPFKTSLAGNPVTIYGKQSVEGDLDYTLSINVNRKFFGKEINNLLKSIPGSNNIESLDVDASVGGTLSKPVIKPDLSKAVKSIAKEAEKELTNKPKDGILKGLEKLFK